MYQLITTTAAVTTMTTITIMTIRVRGPVAIHGPVVIIVAGIATGILVGIVVVPGAPVQTGAAIGSENE